MNLIANVDRNWGLGRDGQLLFHIPADLRFFREKTLGSVVILGRKTLATFPDGRPLKGRRNIVLSRTKPQEPDMIVCDSIEGAVEAASAHAADCDTYVIGGAEVYQQMLPLCDTAYITRVEAVGDADCFLPNLDNMPDWTMEEVIMRGTQGPLSYMISRYTRTAPPL